MEATTLGKRYADFKDPENSAEEKRYEQTEFGNFLQKRGAPLPPLPKMEEFVQMSIYACVYAKSGNEMGKPEPEIEDPALIADKNLVINATKQAIEFDTALKQLQEKVFRTIRSKIPISTNKVLSDFHKALKECSGLERIVSEETGKSVLKLSSGKTLTPADEDQTDFLIACHNLYFFGHYICSILHEVLENMDIDHMSFVELWEYLRGPSAMRVPLDRWTWDMEGATVFVKRIVQLRDTLNATRTWV